MWMEEICISALTHFTLTGVFTLNSFTVSFCTLISLEYGWKGIQHPAFSETDLRTQQISTPPPLGCCQLDLPHQRAPSVADRTPAEGAAGSETCITMGSLFLPQATNLSRVPSSWTWNPGRWTRSDPVHSVTFSDQITSCSVSPCVTAEVTPSQRTK